MLTPVILPMNRQQVQSLQRVAIERNLLRMITRHENRCQNADDQIYASQKKIEQIGEDNGSL